MTYVVYPSNTLIFVIRWPYFVFRVYSGMCQLGYILGGAGGVIATCSDVVRQHAEPMIAVSPSHLHCKPSIDF